MTKYRYQVVDRPKNGTVGQDCGVFAFEKLPERFRAAIGSDPTASEWVLPALSEGDSGEELDDLVVVVTDISLSR
jgi:hypothetical protein